MHHPSSLIKHFFLKYLLITGCFLWLTSLHAQQNDFNGFTFIEFANKQPNTAICLSAKNTEENKGILSNLGIPLKHQSPNYIFFMQNLRNF